MTPEWLEIRDNGTSLRIIWPGGRADKMSAVLLRRESRSAESRRARIDDRPPVESDVKIETIALVGSYAVNIAFSDGENCGIYPWSYLAQLAACEKGKRQPDVSDFMIEGEPA